MKKITVFLFGFFLTSFIQVASLAKAKAEVIDLQKDERRS
jgi:hypothetical protein